MFIPIPHDLLNHIEEMSKDPDEPTMRLFDNYIRNNSPGFRFKFMETIFRSYQMNLYSLDPSKELSQIKKDCDMFLKIVMLIIKRHMKTMEKDGQTQAIIFDIADKNICTGWRDIIDMIPSDYAILRPEYKKEEHIFFQLYMFLKAQAEALPDTHINIPSNEEFLQAMNLNK